MTLIRDLITIPEHVHKGDFVLRLTEGVTKPDETLRDYVVTPQLAACFERALSFVHDAIAKGTSKAAYLHGSFGSGKSHFMAVLHLILQGNPQAKATPELSASIVKHSAWIDGKRFLLVPYHMIGARNMEAGILGGYAEFIRKRHPDAPIPGVYQVDGIFKDAVGLREDLGDEAFFVRLNQAEGATGGGGWGALETAWSAETFEDAIRAPAVPETDANHAPSEPRRRLASALLKTFFKSFHSVSLAQGESYISLDAGLSVLSQHAKALGYDALILFLDELILWLASHSGDLRFVQQEGQKLTKLVEAQSGERPIPIVSFVARQRDLSELVGDTVAGRDKLNFSEILKHWEGRFEKIVLEDRNLPEIAARRVLRPKGDGPRKEIDAAFEKTAKIREEAMNVLLTSKYDRGIFRKVYPFSPALVDTLVGVSSVLQRERTALKVMLQLLVEQRDTLGLGDIVPVGDLFDVIAHGDDAFSEDMRIHFDNAKRLYHQKLLPLLEHQHGARKDELEALPWDDRRRKGFRNDDRLVKTLLLAALCPGVESLRSLDGGRLAALNHGTISSPIPGREGQEVLRRCREWAAGVGEIKVGDAANSANPTISVQLTGVDTESIVEQARGEDNQGNRIRCVRRMLFEAMEIEDSDDLFRVHDFAWRNTPRQCEIIYANLRDLLDASLENDSDSWKLVIDFPFDDAGRTPEDDRRRLESFRDAHPQGARTLVWLPAFFSRDALKDLGRLVILDHILTGERIGGYTSHLSPQERPIARDLLQNQQSQLRQRVRLHLEAAYGLATSAPGSLDSSHESGETFASLLASFTPERPAASSLAGALSALLDQALASQYPAHPRFGAEVKTSSLRKVWDEVERAALAPEGRIEVDKPVRPLLRDIAEPLELGRLHENIFLLGHDWKDHFTRKAGGAASMVSKDLRRWMDEPRARGLPAEVQNLVILAFARQTSRSFLRHGAPYEATLTSLPDDLELRPVSLPSAEDWQVAQPRAGLVLGFPGSPLLSAANVAALCEHVRTSVPRAVEEVRALVKTLRARGLEAVTAPRLATAEATLGLLEKLAKTEPAEVVRAIARADVRTSEAAMGECFRHAATFRGHLEAVTWEIFDGIASVGADRKADAEEILREVREALSNDEHLTPLGAGLKGAQARAVRLLTAVKPTPPPPPPPGPEGGGAEGPGGARPVERSGKGVGLDPAAARRLLDDVEAKLRPGESLSIEVTWRIVGKGGGAPGGGASGTQGPGGGKPSGSGSSRGYVPPAAGPSPPGTGGKGGSPR